MEKEKNKNSKGIIILVILLILINLGLVGYICYDKEIIFTKTEKETKQLNKKSNKKELDLSKCLNTNNITYSNLSDKEGNYGLSMTINEDKTSITLSINWDKFGPLSTASAWDKNVQKYQITGFSKEINSTFIGDLGQESMGITLFYLMDDGTVEYTPMFNKKYDKENNSYYEINYTYDYSADGRISGEYFTTSGSISGVKDVIKLYNANASSDFGWKTTIGATADGNFYDLGNVISK